MQLLQPGDEIVIETPGWPQAEVLARSIGAKIVKVTRREDDGWQLPLDKVAEAVTSKTKMIFISNPNNPTGALLGQGELEDLVRIADHVGAWLLVDEVYAGLEWDGPRAPSIAGMYARGITTGSVSKALGLQGLRTGWLICPDKELVMDAVILRENSSEIMNIMGEVIAEVMREVVAGLAGDSDFRIASDAVACLRGASEDFLLELFGVSNLFAEHAGRVTLMVEDVALYERVLINKYSNPAYVMEVQAMREKTAKLKARRLARRNREEEQAL